MALKKRGRFVGTFEIPVKIVDGEPWFIFSQGPNGGKLRAVHISKVRHVHDWDSHHCNEVSAKTSIRFSPKNWYL